MRTFLTAVLLLTTSIGAYAMGVPMTAEQLKQKVELDLWEEGLQADNSELAESPEQRLLPADLEHLLRRLRL